MRSRYIGPTGQLRVQRLNVNDFNFRRMALVTTIFIVLFFTNPANSPILNRITSLLETNEFFRSPSSKSSRKTNTTNRGSRKERDFVGSLVWDLFGIEMDIFVRNPSPFNSGMFSTEYTPKKSSFSHSETNYLIFSMSKRYNQVYVNVLLNEIPICDLDGSTLCRWIESNFCHGMNMSTNSQNRAFTALRIIQIFKILSFIMDKCHKYHSWCPSSSIGNTMSNPLSPLLSVLHQPNLYTDWFFLTIAMHPAFVSLNKVTLAGTSYDEVATWHFYLSIFFLIFILGASGNLVGSYLSHQGIYGMKGSIGACLGYQLSVNSKKILLRLFEIEMNSGDIMIVLFGMASFTCFIGELPFFGKWNFGEAVAFCFAGLSGHYFGGVQLERYGLWWIPGL